MKARLLLPYLAQIGCAPLAEAPPLLSGARGVLVLALGVLLGACAPAPALDWGAENAVGTEPDAADPAAPEVVFAALGDFGEANDAQPRIAAELGTACDAAGCQFLLALGDVRSASSGRG